MRLLASKMEGDAWKLRSGGAKGADAAFEAGVRNPANRAIYLPGDYFNGRRAGAQGYFDSTQLPGWQSALQTVNEYHPAPERLGDYARALMARNAMQVLGPSLDRPADLVVAWTPGGRVQGGTGQALRMAGNLGIPVRNLGDPEALARARAYLDPRAMPMYFAYQGNAIPGTAPTTFDAILQGQRTSTLRRVGEIPSYIGPGSRLEMYASRNPNDPATRRQIVEVTGRRLVDAAMAPELSLTERWTPEFLANYINRVGGGQLEQILYRLPG